MTHIRYADKIIRALALIANMYVHSRSHANGLHCTRMRFACDKFLENSSRRVINRKKYEETFAAFVYVHRVTNNVNIEPLLTFLVAGRDRGVTMNLMKQVGCWTGRYLNANEAPAHGRTLHRSPTRLRAPFD